MTTERARYAREYLIEGPGMYVPGWLAAWLEVHTNVSQRRTEVRGGDRLVDEALLALRHAALTFRAGSASGTEQAADLPAEAPSTHRLTADEAADRLGVTSRAIRKAIAAGRLRAEQVGRQWLIDPEDLDRFRAARAA